MSDFMENAKAVLESTKFARFELLHMKQNLLEVTDEEDMEFLSLKREVKKLVADRDRQKNLGFLKEAAYDINDILSVMGITKESIVKQFTLQDLIKMVATDRKTVNKAVAIAFPAVKAANSGVLATFGNEDFSMGPRVTKALGSTIQKGGVKGFVEALTDAGKMYMMENYKSDAGPYKGSIIYPNVNTIATKFKFDKKALRIALGIDIEEVKEEAKDAKKSGKKEPATA